MNNNIPPPLPTGGTPPPLPGTSDRYARLALTKKDEASLAGQALIHLAHELLEDGELTPAELLKFRDFLKSQGDAIPAIRHLRMLMDDVWSDGVATEKEIELFHRQIERVLPGPVRKKISDARKEKETRRKEAKKAEIEDERREKQKEREELEARRRAEREEWQKRASRASEAQLHYLSNLGVSPRPGLTKQEASDLIERALKSPNRSITKRQMMVLRFWDKVPPPEDWGKNEVIEWMDAWYTENPARLYAWELYKKEVGDTGNIRDPESVGVGIGNAYLEKVVASGVMEKAASAKSNSGCGCVTMIAIIIGLPTFAWGAYQLLC